jgi:uncharacterized membrane protein
MKNYISKFKFEIIIGVLILLYIGYFSFLTIMRHKNLQSNYYDLAIMDQTVYNTYRGRILELTNPEGINNFKRMAIHNDLVMVLLAPFYFIYLGPETIILIQVIIVALGAIPIYLLCKTILKSKYLGIIIGFAYLTYPPLQRANIFDFHSVLLATSFILFMFYFFTYKKYWMAFIFFLLSIFSKEQIPLTTGLFSLIMILYAYKEKDKKKLFFSYLFFSLSIFWFIASIWFIIPYFRQGQHFALSRYESLGKGPTGVIKGFLTKPLLIINLIFNKENYSYLFLLLAPVSFFSIFSPLCLIIAAPEFLINFLSNHWQMRGIDHHYTAVIIPFIFISAIYGIRRILERKVINVNIIAFLIVLFSLIFSYYKGLLPFSKEFPSYIFQDEKTNIDNINIWRTKLKDENISVSVTEKLGSHFSQRIKLYRFSESYKYADYVLILRNDIYYDWLDKKQAIKDYKKLKEDSRYNMIYQENDFEVYKKI